METAPRTEEYTLTMFLVKRTGEGAFSRRFTQHRILPEREARFPFSIGEIDFERFLRLRLHSQLKTNSSPCGHHPCSPAQAPPRHRHPPSTTPPHTYPTPTP